MEATERIQSIVTHATTRFAGLTLTREVFERRIIASKLRANWSYHNTWASDVAAAVEQMETDKVLLRFDGIRQRKNQEWTKGRTPFVAIIGRNEPLADFQHRIAEERAQQALNYQADVAKKAEDAAIAKVGSKYWERIAADIAESPEVLAAGETVSHAAHALSRATLRYVKLHHRLMKAYLATIAPHALVIATRKDIWKTIDTQTRKELNHLVEIEPGTTIVYPSQHLYDANPETKEAVCADITAYLRQQGVPDKTGSVLELITPRSGLSPQIDHLIDMTNRAEKKMLTSRRQAEQAEAQKQAARDAAKREAAKNLLKFTSHSREI